MKPYRSRWLKRVLLLFGSLLAAMAVVSTSAFYLFYALRPADLP